MSRRAAFLALLVLSPATALGQGPRPLGPVPTDGAIRPVRHAIAVPEARSPTTLGLAGLMGGGAGFLAGGLLGAAAAADCGGDGLCQLAGAIYGGILGQAVGIPVGVHLANGRRGRLGPALVTSLAIGLGSILAVQETEVGELLLVAPVVQIVVSAAIERGSARRAR